MNGGAAAPARRPGARMVSWAMAALAAALLVLTLVLLLSNRSVVAVRGGALLTYGIIAATVLAFGATGFLISTRLPRNPIGWILLTVALSISMSAFAEQYAVRGLVADPGSLLGVPYVAWLGDWSLDLAIIPLLFVFLLFPTGRVPSRRWRPVAWAGMAVLAVGLTGWMIHPHVISGLTNELLDHKVGVPNPFGLSRLKSPLGTALGAAGVVGLIIGILSIVSVVVRLRRSQGEERQQVRWLAYAGLLDVVLFVATLIASTTNSTLNNILFGLLFVSLFLTIPLASGIAILKYRLYDLDIVVKKTVVFGALVAFFTVVYVAVVVGIGAAVGSRGNTVLTFAAAALVAVAFQPVRARARRFADRLVYGKRATPYEVLSQFAERMSGGYSTEDVLPEMARIVAAGTGASRADVWLRIGSDLRQEATWPADGERRVPAPVLPAAANDEVPAMPGAPLTFPVRHQDELLGAISVIVPPSDPLTPSQQKLVLDVASQAGLVLRNVRLIEELRASRQRIVAAQDARAKALERNIHDGAQQQLVALAVKLRLATNMVGGDQDAERELLEQLGSEAQEALENLRDLARGIYPPLLADQGLAAALAAQARKASIPVEVQADGLGRYPQEVEAAVYFCCLEALQNVAKYARAARAGVRVEERDGVLAFVVEDDGAGFDEASTPRGSGLTNMADRLAALDGSVEVTSRPGSGTTVRGRIPISGSPRPVAA